MITRTASGNNTVGILVCIVVVGVAVAAEAAVAVVAASSLRRPHSSSSTSVVVQRCTGSTHRRPCLGVTIPSRCAWGSRSKGLEVSVRGYARPSKKKKQDKLPGLLSSHNKHIRSDISCCRCITRNNAGKRRLRWWPCSRAVGVLNLTPRAGPALARTQPGFEQDM